MRRDGRRGERGATAVLVALTLTAMGALLALSFNIGHHRMVRGQLQNAADAAALAGAKDLDGTLAPLTAGLPQTDAVDFAGRAPNDSDRSVQTAITASDVVLGHWDPYAAPGVAFVAAPGTPTTGTEALNVNAVRVRTYRDARTSAVDVFFGGFLDGRTGMDVETEAIAVNGGPCIEACPNAPLAISACPLIDPTTGQLNCDTTLQVTFNNAQATPAPTDTIGLTSLSIDTSASVPAFRDILSRPPGCNDPLSVTASIPVQNGNSLFSTLCKTKGGNQPTFNQFCAANGAGYCTNPVEFRAPIVGGPCPPAFNQTLPVVGFATVRMVSMTCAGAGGQMTFEFLCDKTSPDVDRIGCGWWGTGPLHPRLVR